MGFFENFWEIMLGFIWLFVLFACLSALFTIIGHIFRDEGLNGWGKAGWLLLLVFIPFMGVLVYLIARGKTMDDQEAAYSNNRQSYYDDGYRYDNRILI